MAKKNKKLSKRKQVELLKKQGYSYSQARKINEQTRTKLSDLIISDNEHKKKEKTVVQKAIKERKKTKNNSALTFRNRVTKKRFYLDSIGVKGALERGVFSDKKIDSIKLKDIENNNVTRETYQWLFVSDKFDFNKKYKFKNGKRMFVAFRDYQGELDIADALNQFSKYNDGALINFLEHIVNTKATYRKGVSGSSSGRAGDYKFMIADAETLSTFNKEVKLETNKDKYALGQQQRHHSPKNKRKYKRQQYKGDKVGYQVLKDGYNVAHDEVTPRNLLIMANAIMHNITEKDRANFYTRFYDDITKNIPEMIEILPKK